MVTWLRGISKNFYECPGISGSVSNRPHDPATHFNTEKGITVSTHLQCVSFVRVGNAIRYDLTVLASSAEPASVP